MTRMGVSGSIDISSRYTLQKVKLGQGSFATVWRAVNKSTDEVVAVKELEMSKCSRVGVTQVDIEREIRVMRACKHQNVIHLIDTFESSTGMYFVFEYCDQGNFADKLQARPGGLQEDMVSYSKDVCSATAALHSCGVCHRNIKPDNFMVANQMLKLTDFGLAVFLRRDEMLHHRCGTTNYMSPELRALPDGLGYSYPVDVWAAGVTVYMIVTGGKLPVIGKHGLEPQGIFGRVAGRRHPEAAREILVQMLEQDPKLRITAEQVLQSQWFSGDLASARQDGRETSNNSGSWLARKCGSGTVLRSAINIGTASKFSRRPVSELQVKPADHLQKALHDQSIPRSPGNGPTKRGSLICSSLLRARTPSPKSTRQIEE